MFYEGPEPSTFPVGAAIAQYVFVKVNSSGQVVVTGAGEDAIGVTLEGVSSQEFTDGKRTVPVALIQKGGKCPVKAKASSAIAVGDVISSAANGEAVATLTTNARLGIALEVANVNAAQEIITILFDKAARLTP